MFLVYFAKQSDHNNQEVRIVPSTLVDVSLMSHSSFSCFWWMQMCNIRPTIKTINKLYLPIISSQWLGMLSRLYDAATCGSCKFHWKITWYLTADSLNDVFYLLSWLAWTLKLYCCSAEGQNYAHNQFGESSSVFCFLLLSCFCQIVCILLFQLYQIETHGWSYEYFLVLEYLV